MSLRIWLGLGNSGSRYSHTRHNIGWQLVDTLARELGVSFDSEKYSQIAKTPDVTLLKLPGYMNESGHSLQQVLSFYKWDIHDVLVIYDDIDFAVGQVKLRFDGGSGGHRGLESVLEACGASDIWRLRLGIRGQLPVFESKAHKDEFMVKYVLSSFTKDEKTVVDNVFRDLAPLVARICKDPTQAMNAVNRLDNSLSP